jgi:hypothetical protein
VQLKISIQFADRLNGSFDPGTGMKQNEQKCLNKKDMNGDTPMPAPVSGLNDNLEFMGRQLHIQTENTGLPPTRIVTQVFCGGRVILSRKTDHTSIMDDSGSIVNMRDLMNSQHHQIIKEIKDKLVQLQAEISQQDL